MRARPGTAKRMVKLTDAEWEALARIAAREGLDWGGLPSRSEAVRWLIARDPEGRDLASPARSPAAPDRPGRG